MRVAHDFKRSTPTGIRQTSIPPKHLLRAMLLQAFSSVCSEPHLMESTRVWHAAPLVRWTMGGGLRNGWAGILPSLPETLLHSSILHGA
jgi:hypothetical protein